MAKKSILLPTILMLIGVAILCGLGNWQLKRLEWKNSLVEALNAEYAKDEPDILTNLNELDEEFLFRRRALQGTYNYDAQILVGPRTYNKLAGYHVITPLKLQDGSYILVNRGWAPQPWSPADETNRPQGETTVRGVLRASEHNSFTPDNIPDKNQWYYADPQRLAATRNLRKMHDKILYDENPLSTGNYPVATATKPHLENNHFQYAMFWFLMAGTLVVIYCLLFLRKE